MQRYRSEIHIQGYHLRSDCGLVLRTQSMFQVVANAPGACRLTPLHGASHWSYVGEAAGLATSLLWTVSSVSFTAAGRRLGSSRLNLIRSVLAMVILAGLLAAATGMPWPQLERGRHSFWPPPGSWGSRSGTSSSSPRSSTWGRAAACSS